MHGAAAEVHVSLVGRKDLTGELYRQLRRAILDDRLPAGLEQLAAVLAQASAAGVELRPLSLWD